MAISLNAGGVSLTPSHEQVALASNYISDMKFLSQNLPDTYEQEFERYGNRSVSSFLRLVGAEIPSASDLIQWTEQGRLHTKYVNVASPAVAGADTATYTVSDAVANGIAIRVGQTLMIVPTAGGSAGNKGIVTVVDTAADTFNVAFYEAGGKVPAADVVCTVMIYGSEFKKGTNGMVGSNEAQIDVHEVSPIIIKDKYSVSGSDMAQIGWVEVDTDGGSGFLWYLKSQHETRLRFEDYLETAMIEAVPAEVGSGAVAASGNEGNKGTEGVFYAVENKGNIASGGNPTSLGEFDTIVARLDAQGAIEENVLFVNRGMSFDIDDMLAAQSTSTGASYGLFDNDKDMSLNLGFSGFRRGYDFYKSDWKYLNDQAMRGGLASDVVNGLLVPAGSTTVYDQVLGKNAKRPFLHVRYRASQAEDRKMKTWITGSAGGAATSDLDAMEVNFLSERAICTLGANNFMIFTD
jgi:hypothetical protein